MRRAVLQQAIVVARVGRVIAPAAVRVVGRLVRKHRQIVVDQVDRALVVKAGTGSSSGFTRISVPTGPDRRAPPVGPADDAW